jgi:hypothetical protein
METGNYVLNERLKRIEPTSKKCTYCVSGQSNNINDCYFVPLFKENDRTNIIVYRSVKYSKVSIGVSRCADCKAIHEAAKKKALVISLIAFLLVLSFIIYNFLDFDPIASAILFFVALFVGFGGYAYLKNYFTRKKDIHTLKEGAEYDPLVQDFLTKGWSFTQPSA